MPARTHSKTAILLAGGLLLSTAGCLSLGGRTTYVQESPDVPARLTSLEQRVSQLEQSIATPPPATPIQR